MNICYVIDTYYPPLGGASLVTKNQAIKLIERGHKVIIITSKTKKLKCDEGYIEGIKTYNFFGIQLIHDYYFCICPSRRRIKEILEREQIRVVHAHMNSYLSHSVFEVAKKMNIHCIVSNHMSMNHFISYLWFDPHNFVSGLIEKRILKFFCHADLIMGESTYFVNKYQRILPHKKFMLLSNGVDLNIFGVPQKPLSFREKFDIKTKFVVLYVGRLMKEKNVKFLIETIPDLIREFDLTLIIVGNGPQLADLTNLVTKLKMENKIILTGFLCQDDLISAYNDCDVFVLPSFAETQGIVLLEAMSFAKPLLISDRVESRFDLIKDNGFVFQYNNKKDFVKKMTLLLKQKQLRHKFGKNSKKIVKEHDIQKVINKLEKIYEGLIK